jgi:hypothetical protein
VPATKQSAPRASAVRVIRVPFLGGLQIQRRQLLATTLSFSTLCLTTAIAGSCRGDSAEPAAPNVPVTPVVDTTPLRALADRRGFRIGTAVDRGFRLSGADGTRFMGLVAREFNVLTAENDMKHERL